jgi:hypothetical protein
VQDGHICKNPDRPVVVHVAAVGRQDAVVAVRRVGVEGDVGHHRHARHGLLYSPDGTQDKGVLAQGGRTFLVFEPRGYAGKQRDGQHTELPEGSAFLHQVGNSEAEYAGHGGDRLGAPLSVDHEKGGDQVLGAKDRVLDQSAEPRRAPKPSGALDEIELEGAGHGFVGSFIGARPAPCRH